MVLALFDFDGTITHTDSLLHFTIFAKGKVRYFTGMLWLLPLLVLHKAGLFSSKFTKNKFLTYFFKGESETHFNSICSNYAKHNISSIVRHKALERILWHKNQHHRVIVVSASPEAYLQKWCNMYSVECIGTNVEVLNGSLTGKVAGENCNGQEKVNRIKKHLCLEEYTEIYGYGNSGGDKPMLSLCTETFYKPFE